MKHLFLLIILFFLSSFLSAQTSFPPINPKDVTIIRDQWGIPHIYGKTDADAAYGLAWAHAEDDFQSMQEALLAINSRLSEVQGPGGAVMDILVFLINADRTTGDKFETAFSPKFRKVLQANVQAINDYAQSHPEELLIKDIFPITEREIIKGYTLAQVALSNAAYGIARMISNHMNLYRLSAAPNGSNGFALNSKKTTDGSSMLISNTHQPIEGPLSWYEAHVCSEEGWNMLGGSFSTGVTLFLGANENLSWTHTTNYPDLHDVYELRMHPKKKKQYYFDGEWLELEKRTIKLKVKVKGIKIPVKRTYYWSKYGPTIKNKEGFFAIRMPAAYNIKAAEQWYWMNKANSYEEFMEALNIQGLACQNIIYADKDDNIYYLCNGQFPYRAEGYDWEGILPGDTSATLWDTKFHPLKDLPQIKNPKSGYLYNANNTPFSATDPAEDMKPDDFHPSMGFLEKETNRALRFQERIKDYDKISYEEMKAIKYDYQYCSHTFYTNTLENINFIYNLPPDKYPDLADVIDIGKRWNKSTDPDNKQATIFAIAITRVLKYYEKESLMALNNTLPEEVYIEAFRWAKKFLLKHYGSLEVPLGKVQVHARGDKSYPLGGMPEVLAAMIVQPHGKTQFRSGAGESYILFSQYKDGQLSQLETIHPYGASNRPSSPHYTDQMELYAQQKLKRMTLDKKEILKNATRIYYPGEKGVE